MENLNQRKPQKRISDRIRELATAMKMNTANERHSEAREEEIARKLAGGKLRTRNEIDQ